MIHVFGHLSPDTDATTAAIVWSWYLNTHHATGATPYVLGELNNETLFVLNHFGFMSPELLPPLEAGTAVVVVDTNNPQELPANINELNLVTLIDHHKLVGGLSSDTPTTITLRPVAATATVIYDLITASGCQIPKDIAGLLVSAILSDTLGFRSPTTTPHDKDVAEKLATLAEIDLTTHADAMFAAKSDISGFSDSGLIKLDSKKFAVGDKNLRVSVIETTHPATVLARKDGIITAIKTLVEEESDTDDVLLFIVDILKEEATVLTYNDLTKTIIEKSFAVTVTTDTEVLPGIVSRKKQILPALTI